MAEYIPIYAKKITVIYEVAAPAQIQTRSQPGFQEDIEITQVLVNGNDPGEFVQSTLLDQHEKDWICEIRSKAKEAA